MIAENLSKSLDSLTLREQESGRSGPLPHSRKSLPEPPFRGRQQVSGGDHDSGVLSRERYRLKFDDQEAFVFLIGLYETGRMRFAKLETWLRAHAFIDTSAG